MNTLALNTAFTHVGLSLTKEDRLVANYFSVCKKRSERLIFQAMDELLENAQMEISQIDYYTVIQGPGSYTGLRIGMAVAKTLAQVHQKPVIGVNSLEYLASMVLPREAPFYVLLNCTRSEVFFAQFQFDTESSGDSPSLASPVKQLTDIHLTTLDKIWDTVEKESVMLMQTVPNPKLTSPRFQELSVLSLRYPIADAYPLLELGKNYYNQYQDHYPIVNPIYLKKDA